ncbi:hypothetical protein [Streptomyces sp. NPDC018955]
MSAAGRAGKVAAAEAGYFLGRRNELGIPQEAVGQRGVVEA